MLMDHPAVQQVVTFGMPHEKLGEEVAAAVVLREGQKLDERELRDFAADAAGRLQGAAQGGVPRRDPEGRDRQAAAHRTGREARARRMKVGIFGAGAIGGFLGAKLAAAGADVTFLARGPHLAAMQARGVTLTSGDATASWCTRAASPMPARRGCRISSSSP